MRSSYVPVAAFFLLLTVHCGSETAETASPIDPSTADAAAPDDASDPGTPGNLGPRDDAGPDAQGPDGGPLPVGTGAFLAGTSTLLGDPTAGDWQLADLNGDGKRDVAAKLGSFVTAFGTGDGNFQKTAAYLQGTGPFDLTAAADFDGDGKDDLVGCFGNNGLRVFRGSATAPGGVAPEGDFATFAFGSADYLVSCATADFDGDGKPDVAIGGQNGTVRIGRNTGTSLTATGTLTALGNPYRLVAFDVDGQKGKDLLALDRNSATLRVLLNDGTGAFTATAPVALPASSFDLVPFRESSATSIAVLAGAGTLSVIPLAANGTLGAPVAIGAGTSFGSVAAADIDADGTIELAAAHLGGGVIDVLAHAGNAWTVRQSIRANWLPTRVKLVDVNGDARPDLAWLNGGSPVTFDVLPNTGAGTFVAPETIALDARPFAGGAFADVNGDGRKDVLVAVDSIPNQSYVDVHLGRAGGGFTKSDRVTISDRAYGFSFSDLTGDGKLDVVVRTSYSRILVLTGDGAGHFTAGAGFYGPPDAFGHALGDIDGVAGDELLVSAPGGVRAFSRQPGAFFGEPAKTVTETGWPMLRALTDVDGDGKLDVVVSGLFAGGLAVGRGLGGGSFATPASLGPSLTVGAVVPMKMGALPRRWLVVGADGLHDLAETAAGTTDKVAAGPGGSFVVRADWSGDGIEDLVIGGATIALYRGKADGSFEWSGQSLLGGGLAQAVGLFDATGDGKADIAVVNHYGGVTVLAAR